MSYVDSLECTRCGRSFAPGEVRYTCPDHDGVSGVLDVRYDYEAVKDAFTLMPEGRVDSMWKYAPLLPVSNPDKGANSSNVTLPVTLGEGGTDLLAAPSLGAELDVDLRLKRESANPTGATKDRGSSVVVSRAIQQGFDAVACASTGNAAASLAGYAARADLACHIFVPADLPAAKALQPRAYGATVYGVKGSYQDAYELCREAVGETGWYDRSAAINPFAVEGMRTIGYEIVDQSLASPGRVPDWVVVPMGNGCTISGVWKGFEELQRIGITARTPRLLGVQADGASAIADRVDGTEPTTRKDSGGTRADSIDVQTPHNASKATSALEASDGDAITVSDAEITAAQRELGVSEGVFAEPASAATVAGVRRARERGVVDAGTSVVAVITGTGLKDADAVCETVSDIEYVDGDVDGFLESI